MMEEVDISNKIPSDFHTAISSSAWKERKATLEAMLEVAKANLKIKDSEAVGEVAKACGKRMTDANVQCVMLAANVLEALAQNVGPSFGKYQSALISPMLERLKERKQNVVDTIGQALDAVFATVWFYSFGFYAELFISHLLLFRPHFPTLQRLSLPLSSQKIRKSKTGH